jgi:hypothetical protein
MKMFLLHGFHIAQPAPAGEPGTNHAQLFKKILDFSQTELQALLNAKQRLRPLAQSSY